MSFLKNFDAVLVCSNAEYLALQTGMSLSEFGDVSLIARLSAIHQTLDVNKKALKEKKVNKAGYESTLKLCLDEINSLGQESVDGLIEQIETKLFAVLSSMPEERLNELYEHPNYGENLQNWFLQKQGYVPDWVDALSEGIEKLTK